MFVRIGNTPRDYAWGSTTAIPELLGTTPTGAPEAELWLGAHRGSPSIVLDPSQTSGAADLATWIERDPATTLGAGAHGALLELPFLLKVLAAAGPLSLQAHPSLEQARAGFARENAEGIPLDSPARNYKDPLHKPEMIYPLSDTFDALCGFREPAVSVRLIEAFAEVADAEGRRVARLLVDRLSGAPAEAGLRAATGWLLGGDPDVAELVRAVVRAARNEEWTVADPELATAVDTVRMLAAAFPGDPGIVLALLLNRTRLSRGEVLYLPAGNIHAYLRGVGIELMAASDNVMRGGLTTKHVDVAELLSILDFAPLTVTPMVPDRSEPGVEAYRPDELDFALDVVELGEFAPAAGLTLGGPAIAICTDGALDLQGATGVIRLSRGEAVFITPDEVSLAVSGEGRAFVAVPNG